LGMVLFIFGQKMELCVQLEVNLALFEAENLALTLHQNVLLSHLISLNKSTVRLFL